MPESSRTSFQSQKMNIKKHNTIHT